MGTTFTPTIDGWFNRISLDLDPQFGTENDFKQMVSVAGQPGAITGVIWCLCTLASARIFGSPSERTRTTPDVHDG
jgi:hypothetical protein